MTAPNSRPRRRKDTEQAPPPPPAPAFVHRRGPSDTADAATRQEIKKALVWLGIAALMALVVLLAQPLLVIFAGLVFAAAIDGGARLLGRVLAIGRGWRLLIVLLLTALFLAWTVYFTGSQIATQASELPGIVENQARIGFAWLNTRGITLQFSDLQGLAQQALGGVGQVTKAVGGLFGMLGTLFLVLVIGIYLAAEPQLYRRGVGWMLPAGERDYFEGTATEMGRTLRMIMFGRLIGMLVEGIATWALLAAYGVPMAALLGLLTGLLAFLPNIGAPISGALMVLVGFSGGTEMGLFCIGVYVAVQVIDGNVIVPMIAKKTADLAPALVLGAQLIMGVLFGVLGLMLADPLVAMIKIALERHSERGEPVTGGPV